MELTISGLQSVALRDVAYAKKWRCESINPGSNELFLQSISDDKETIRLICKWNKDMTDILRSRFVQVKDIAISLWDFYLETNKEN